MNKRSWMTTETTVQSEKLNEGVSHGSTEPPSGVAGGFLAMLEIALVATAGFILVPLVMALFGLSPHAIMNSSTSMVILLVSEATLTLLLIRFLMALRGEQAQIPKDVKFRVEPAGGMEGFLGLYGQVVLNEVQGRSYPYFYVVPFTQL
jgi:hypothetical protein